MGCSGDLQYLVDANDAQLCHKCLNDPGPHCAGAQFNNDDVNSRAYCMTLEEAQDAVTAHASIVAFVKKGDNRFYFYATCDDAGAAHRDGAFSGGLYDLFWDTGVAAQQTTYNLLGQI